MFSIVKKIFGSKNDREIKKILNVVNRINALEGQMESLQDADFALKTAEFKQRVQNGERLKDILPEAFALVREASKRSMGMRHFDVQLIGGIVLHNGNIAEMRTGEGKTLVATAPVYLNALVGKGVHVITVNDYLAKRDSSWMKTLYEFLGLTVGVIYPMQDYEEKKSAYAADITYGTNNEFGFDYLRDNMAFSQEEKVQRELFFAVVDEVDSILIDEARTPLIISGQAEDSSELYIKINKLIPHLKQHKEFESVVEQEGHFNLDEKSRQIDLTEQGYLFVEDLLRQNNLLSEEDSLYAPHNLTILTHVYSALRANVLFHKNVEYVVQQGQILLIDEHTGRPMHGRRLSDGLHQAIEAKEGLNIQPETQTLASTTFQNYFRIYKKLSGMTGTADTEAFEFRQIYGLDVIVIPTNKPIARIDHNDLIYATKADKYNAIIEDVLYCTNAGRPVLVGTASIEDSEYLSSLMQRAKIKHQVLNAKHHDKEALIIAQAGKSGSVTIATNMAGRGTDIILGGNIEAELHAIEDNEEQAELIKSSWQENHQKVLSAGGLHVISSERHESRRIDNQLRGRAGRQGDPGSSRFYLSLEDNLMRIFASDLIRKTMNTLGLKDNQSIEHPLVTSSIEKAQRKVEERNFEIRKQLLEYDDVANEQRRVVYSMRNDLLLNNDIFQTMQEFRLDVLSDLFDENMSQGLTPDLWKVEELQNELQYMLGMNFPIQEWINENNRINEELLKERVFELISAKYQEKEELIGSKNLRDFEKQILLRILDENWKEHLSTMDHLRQGIHLRGYAQKNPKQEYKRESFMLFKGFLDNVKKEAIRVITNVVLQQEERIQDTTSAEENKRKQETRKDMQNASYSHDADEKSGDSTQNIGRNALCPCGSGKKYKRCHGKLS